MANVLGKKVIMELSADSGTTWKILVCETSSGFRGRTETTSEQTKCDDGATITSPGAKSWEMNASGVVKKDPTTAQVSYQDILDWWNASTTLTGRLTDPDATFLMSGSVWITELSADFPTNGSAAFSATFTGDGALTTTP
jgi:hypothetical protein